MKINMTKATRYVVGASVISLTLWEAVAIASGQPNATISEAIWDEDSHHPYVGFFAGVLCGHLFWQIARTVGANTVTAQAMIANNFKTKGN